jgi:peroxiredoxin
VRYIASPIFALAVALLIANGGGTVAQDKGKGHDHHAAAYDECAKACNDCQSACDACATHCAKLVSEGKKEHLKILQTCQDCATHCSAAAGIVARKGPFSDLICKACADACKRCGDQCEKFKDDPVVKKCADECRKCEKACRDMLKHVGHHDHHGQDGGHHDKGNAPQGTVKVGDKVPDFSVRTLDGKSIKLSELRKDARRTKAGVVVLSFWCSTCHSCRDVEHLLAKLCKDYGGRAAVFALDANFDETAESVAAFVRKNGLELPVVLDPGAGTADLFGVQRTTTTVVIDGNGVLRYCGQFRQKGGGSAEEALEAVLAGKEVAVKTTPHNG